MFPVLTGALFMLQVRGKVVQAWFKCAMNVNYRILLTNLKASLSV